MIRRSFFLFIALLLPLFVSAQTTDFDGVPLPSNALNTATNQTGFAGAWSGLWGHRLKHILVVQNVKPNGDATAIYAYGNLISWGIAKGWNRYPAKIQGSTLSVSGTGFTATYQKLPSGVLMANFLSGRSLAQAVLTPLNLENKHPIWSTAEFGTITTQLTENGAPIRLETVTFKPAGPGPYPLAIVNHGSTGDGKNPSIAKFTFVDTAIAQFLTDRGYLVVFPQRRGRGKSDGLYDEGFNDTRAQGYSCATARSLAGADRAITDLDQIVKSLVNRPDIQKSPILLGGVSRGGMLSMAYAGRHPTQISGVLNFVGGWMGDRCPNAAEINDTLVTQAAKFPRETLWLYGENDPFYTSKHTKTRFDKFLTKGGQGTYHLYDVPGGNGHSLSAAYSLWSGPADAYLNALPSK